MINDEKEVFLLTLPGYEILKLIHEGAHIVVYRGIRSQDKLPVIIKLLKGETPSVDEITRLKKEFEINQMAMEAGEGKVYGLEQIGQNYALIIEDIGGTSLIEIIQSRKLSLKESLTIAVQIAGILARIHKKPIIHKDINPSNIIWNAETNKVKLIDFSISSTLPRERQAVVNPRLLEGTLAYISPEQTGRMNRGIDERTDFYSLGVTLYQMLTGVLPFNSDDPMELIHLHMAKLPEPPSVLDPKIPQVLSEIVLKLMAKNVEERYQSAEGLQFDLSTCLNSFKTMGKIDPFPLGTRDVSDRFEISGKFYGRKEELALLLKLFDDSSQGHVRLLLVAGYSGVGKTALVLEIHKPLVAKRGFFISGKCEQFKQDIPYGGIVQALDAWVKLILAEGDAVKASWAKTLLANVASNGGIITALVPAFEQILGPQSPPPSLGPSEEQERFNLVLVKFLQALTSPEHPLVIFLDDLQWANPSTLQLLKMLLLHQDSKYLLIIGAYRNNEPTSARIESFAKDDLEKRGFIPGVLTLSPLPFSEIWQMLADSLQSLPDRIHSLAEICYSRSGGNPFFFIQLLQYLHQKKLIRLNANHENWDWDLEQIQMEGITESIAELMSYKIQKLEPATQQVIQAASCIGFHFDLKTLANIYQKAEETILKDLWPALQQELIISEGPQNIYFRFLHDRVQQAAYQIITEERREELHYQIGQFLLKTTSKEKLEENIFFIVNHLISGKRLIISEEGGLQLIQLCLLAGKRAKNSTAYKTAVDYLQIAKKNLHENSWEKEYDLSLDISKTLAECLYNSGQLEEADSLIHSAFNHAKTNLEKAQILVIQGNQFTALNLTEKAIDCAIRGLQLFGIHLARVPSIFSLLKELLLTRWNLGRRSVSSLFDLPPMTSKDHIVQIKLLNIIAKPSFFNNEVILFNMVNTKAVNLSLRYGNVEESAIAYVLFGILLNVAFLLKNGIAFMKLAVALNEKWGDLRNRAHIFMIYCGCGIPFEQHLKTLRQTADRGIEAGLRVGDAEWVALLCTIILPWDPVMPRDIMFQESEKYEKLIDPKRDVIGWNFFKIAQLYYANFAGKTNDRFSMSNRTFDEYLALQQCKAAKAYTAVAGYYNCKATIYCLYDNYIPALTLFRELEKISSSIYGMPLYTDFCFYGFLTYIAVFPQLRWQEKIRTYFSMKNKLRAMKWWADFCPINYLHKYLLMKAEFARLKGRKKKAATLYQEAIAAARKYEFLLIEAHATDLAAKFYLALNEPARACTLMIESYYAFNKLGMVNKLRVMEEMYPDILSESAMHNIMPVSSPVDQTVTSTQIPTDKALDINIFIQISQEISSEILLDKLIEKIMRHVIELGGVEKGWLILEKEGNWTVQAEATPTAVHLLAQPIDTLPKSLIDSVIYSKIPLVFSNPAWQGQFATDAYIQRVLPKEVLCMPLINRGELRGVLYLENNSMKSVFTPERLEMLNLLGPQIAISIGNARLYSSSINLNKHLTALKESQSRFIPHEFLAILGKKSIIDVSAGDSTEKEMTVLFADFLGMQSKKITSQENFKMINDCLSVMVPVIRSHQGFIDKYIGNGFMALFPTEADTALQAAIAIIKSLKIYNSGHPVLQIGIGLNSGRVMLGTVGETRRLEETVISDAVNSASRLQKQTKIYGAPLLISNETRSRLKTAEQYEMRWIDTINMRGKAEPITIYEVFEAESPEMIQLKRQSRGEFEKGVSLFRENRISEALGLFEKIVKSNPDDVPAARWCAIANKALIKGKNKLEGHP